MADQNFRVKNGLDVGIGGTIITTTGIGSVGIGSTQPGSTLVVNAPSGYSGDILNIQDTDYTYGTRFRVTAGVSSVYLVTDGFNSSTFSSQGYWFSSSRIGSGTQRHGMSTRYSSASAGIAFWALGNAIAGAANNGFFVDGTYGLGWSSGSVASGNPDTFILRDAANTLAQRNGTNPNTFRIYNTYTSATNFERAQVGWTTNTFIVGTEKGVDGGTARQLELQTDGTTRVAITTTGLVGIGSTQPIADLDVNGTAKISDNITLGSNKTVSSTGGLTISNSVGSLNINSGGTGGNVNISGISVFIGNGSGRLQAGTVSGKNATNYTSDGSDLTVHGGDAIAPSSNSSREGGDLYIKSGQGGGLSGNAGNVYIDGGGTNGGTGTVGNVLIGTVQTSNVGIGSTQPTATLDVVGDVKVGVNTSQGLILTDANGVAWRLNVNTDGSLSTTLV